MVLNCSPHPHEWSPGEKLMSFLQACSLPFTASPLSQVDRNASARATLCSWEVGGGQQRSACCLGEVASGTAKAETFSQSLIQVVVGTCSPGCWSGLLWCGLVGEGGYSKYLWVLSPFGSPRRQCRKMEGSQALWSGWPGFEYWLCCSLYYNKWITHTESWFPALGSGDSNSSCLGSLWRKTCKRSTPGQWQMRTISLTLVRLTVYQVLSYDVMWSSPQHLHFIH